MNAQATTREEFLNAFTHGAGAVAAVAGGAVLITLAVLFGNRVQVVSAMVFVATLIALYSISTLYHAVRHEPLKTRLKVLDHCAIFLLIAGTYTPFTLVALKGGWGWTLFALIWALAALGVVFKLFFTGRFRRMSTVLYVGMGWLGIVAIGPLVDALSMWTLGWLLAGGVAYTAGTLFYHNERVPYAHAIWHLFVLAGSVLHFVAVASLVVPPAAFS